MSNDSLSFPSLVQSQSVSKKLSKAFEKLSSGKRINSASDDAAGLAIASSLESSIKSLAQASRNISDSVSRLEIADGALSQVSDITGRLSELAAQSANGTLSDEQRGAIQTEYSQLTEEIGRIAQTTEFNGQAIFDGSTFTSQVGLDSGGNSRIAAEGVNLSQLAQGLTTQNLSSQGGAQAALDQIKSFADSVSNARSSLGASSTRLQRARDINDVTRENAAAAESRIRDVDVAEETARLTSLRIRQDIDTAVNAQGKLSRASVLSLLGGGKK